MNTVEDSIEELDIDAAREEFLGSLKDAFSSIFDGKEDGVVPAIVEADEMSASTLEKQDLSGFIETIIDKVVTGPMQEIFTGAEIINAINNNKAIAFSAAFVDIAEKSVSIAMQNIKDSEALTYKDFRDFFGLSVFGYAVNSASGKESLKSFLPTYDILDSRSVEFGRALTDFFYTMPEDLSSSCTLAMLLKKNFSDPDDKSELSWGKPQSIDTIFRY